MGKKKYIDVAKWREEFYNDVLNILTDDTTNDRANEIIDVFDSLPAADVQEVVRCKDCKHLLKDLSEREAHLCVRTPLANSVTLDSYCSYGERKDGESNA